ncbi:uncharacterized protein LOC128858666 [Anastrepha ludens]|uniref:uncharacterized protein LOC128858666 n=1 Tax=Anastrepha ludens TaxID=28586 RepID=UPI0023AEB460|nr:uncharacterized protein LOC128858666 [Anastrepha ludens]
MAPRKNNSDLIWEYFENQKEIGKAVCSICQLVLKNDRSYNLKSHLIKVHKINFYNIEKKFNPSNSDSTTTKSCRKMNLKVPRNRNKNNSNLIWGYFENQEEIGKAVCNICKLVLKNNRIYNLKKHLIKKHKINLCIPSKSDLTPPICSKKQNIKVQVNIKNLFKSYIGLVAEDSVPFDVLDSSNFKNIIDPICHGLGKKLGKRITLNAKNCQTALHQVAENIRTNMRMEMNRRLLSLKIDSASKLSRKIFAISAQFLKENEIKSLILGMIELKDIGASASFNLAEEILKTLQKYDIQLNQIVSITADSGTNTIETTTILSSYNTSEHERMEKDLNGTYLNNISPSNSRVEQIQICTCAAHTAQLCALDVTKDPEIEELLSSSRNFIKFIRNPANGIKEAFELRNIQLPQLDCYTTYGSTYEMIVTLLAAKDILIDVEPIGSNATDEHFHNNNSLWDFMECYCAVFAPLQDAMKRFQAENLHYGDFYAQWLKCQMLTNKIIRTNLAEDMAKKIGNKILKSMEKRTSELLENESLNACLFLDPRFHHTLSSKKRLKAVIYLNNLWEKLCSFSPTSQLVPNDNTLMENEVKFEDEAEEMLNSFLTEKLQASSAEVKYTDLLSKISNLHLPFLRSDTDVLQFWKEKEQSEPELYALSNVCFGIPTTHVTIEGAFSSLADNCNQMSHETLEDILLVKTSPVFLNKAINSLTLFED